jgi:predicted ATPase/DNA-binding SARP family transcriptional activator
MESQSTVVLRCLGSFDVAIDGVIVDCGGPKQRSLLAYLVLHAGEPVDLDTLVRAVWGDDAPDGAVRSLRTYVSNLRRLLGAAVELRGERGTYRLDLRSAETDIDRFRAAVEEAATVENPRDRSGVLEEGIELWRGPFLAGIDRSWVQEESAILGWERQRAVATWAEATIDGGQTERVIPVLALEVADAPLDERLCGLLMRALYGSGRQADALAAYRRLRDGLAQDLGVEPGLDLRELEEQILLHEAATGEPEPRGLLPFPTSGLVGRDAEVEDLLARTEQVRVLTLTGPGGVGKTRLAIELGRRISERRDRPVFFADLSTISDESAVDTILTSCVRVQPHPDSGPLASLIEYLRPRSALLIVDNCEHVAATTARSLAALARSCPQVTLVATSRAPLHIDGELEWRTPSLALPEQDDASLEDLRQWPAVELLLKRAPTGFELTDANRTDVVDLCRSLDGLPLALELAASRLGSMTPAEVGAALESRLQVPRSDSSGESRHETLEATISWSYELLSERPRRLLDRLGVMSGGFLFEDVLSVCIPQPESAEIVRGWLSTLVDQSLLMAETSGTRTRYRLLETIRRFALDRLGDDEPDIRRSHAHHYAALAELEAARLLTREESDAVGELSAAHDNLRSAVGWTIETGDVDTASRIVASISDWGYFRSHYELSRWARWVWEAATPGGTRWRAVCGSAARGAWIEGQFDDAVRFGSAATAVGTVIALSAHPDDCVADIALYRGDPKSALVHYSRAAAQAKERGDTIREVWSTCYVALTNAVLRQASEAAEAATRALVVARETGNPTLLAFSLYTNGLAVKHRIAPEAIAMFEEAVRMADSVANDWFGGIARMELASTKTGHGDLDRGFRDFAGVINHWHRAGDDTQLRFTWRYLVRALADVGLPDDAAILSGALLVDVGSALSHPHPQLLDGLKEVLGDSEYTRLTIRGSIMSVPELVTISLHAIDRAVADEIAARGA